MNSKWHFSFIPPCKHNAIPVTNSWRSIIPFYEYDKWIWVLISVKFQVMACFDCYLKRKQRHQSKPFRFELCVITIKNAVYISFLLLLYGLLTVAKITTIFARLPYLCPDWLIQRLDINFRSSLKVHVVLMFIFQWEFKLKNTVFKTFLWLHLSGWECLEYLRKTWTFRM